MLNYFPKYFTSKAIYLYLAALFVVSMLFFNQVMSLIWWILGVGAVVGFFYYSNLLTRKWSEYPEKYLLKIFQTALIVRIAWVVISYLYLIMTENLLSSLLAILFYDEMGRYGAGLMAHGQFPAFTSMSKYAGRLALS